MTDKNRSPRITVLMSVFNGEPYISESVRSILNQTFTDFEFLIIDDGSTDGTSKILERFSENDSRIRVLRQNNQGLIASLNLGLSLARGQFIARMDADDISLPRRLFEQVIYLEANPSIGLVGGQVAVIDESGSSHALKRLKFPTSARAARKKLHFGSPVAHPACMFRTRLAKSSGGYRSYFTHCEDYDLWLRISEKTETSNLKNTVLLYRVHDTNTSVMKRHLQIKGSLLAYIAYRYRRDGKPDPVESWSCIELQSLSSSCSDASLFSFVQIRMARMQIDDLSQDDYATALSLIPMSRLSLFESDIYTREELSRALIRVAFRACCASKYHLMVVFLLASIFFSPAVPIEAALQRFLALKSRTH